MVMLSLIFKLDRLPLQNSAMTFVARQLPRHLPLERHLQTCMIQSKSAGCLQPKTGQSTHVNYADNSSGPERLFSNCPCEVVLK